MQVMLPGKIKLLAQSDLPALQIFCDTCAELGWDNNKDFDAMKLNQTVMPNGQFFIAIDGDTIYSVAGVQKLPQINDRAWRCLLRGAQLPGYTPAWSMDIFKSGIHFAYFLYEQIKFVQQHDCHAEFYITTNLDNPKAGASSRLHKTMMPRLSKQGYIDLINPDIRLYHTQQSLWQVNVSNYMAARERWQAGENCID